MAIPFVKMHGLGNDYVYLDAVTRPDLAGRADLGELALRMSDRHRGVGADGLIVIGLPDTPDADVRMRIFNADGGEAEMCGNGVRCVAKFAYDRLGMRGDAIRVQVGTATPRVLRVDVATDEAGRVASATVDMGPPGLDLVAVPFLPRLAGGERASGVEVGMGMGLVPGAREYELHAGGSGKKYWAVPVSMGNPHAVIFLERSEFGRAKEVLASGPDLERHPAFPQRTNVHLVETVDDRSARMWTWERGAGATQACGTGACAVLVAGVLTGRLGREATLTLPGGELKVRWDEAAGHVFKTGPAAEVCEGSWPEPGDGPGVRELPTLAEGPVVLRPMTLGDAPAVAALAGDRKVYEYTLLIPHPYRLEHATSWVAGQRREWELGRSLNLAITAGGELVGAIGLVLNERHGYAEIGYWVGVPHWGKGYATAASRALIGYAFRELKLNRVHAYHFPGNEASGRVMRKLGMTLEGTSRQDRVKAGRVLDSILYAVTREQWVP